MPNNIRPEIKTLAKPIGNFRTHERNVRQGDIGAICTSLEAHGQYRPIVVHKETNQILAGNHTFLSAQALGWDKIAVTFVDCDDEQAMRILLADNRSNDLATYDDGELIELLRELSSTQIGLEGTLYDGDDLDALIQAIGVFEFPIDDEPVAASDDDDFVSLLDSTPAVSKTQDVWLLGDHRVMCGDCRNSDDVEKLIGIAEINIGFTSPPYAEQRVYDETSAFKPIAPDEYVEWFADVASNVQRHLASDGSWFVNIKPPAKNLDTDLYVFDLVIAHARRWGWHFASEFCWERTGVPKQVVRRFKNGFEPVYQFALGEWKMRPMNVAHESDDVPMSLGAGSGDTGWANKQGNGQIISKDRIRKNKHPHTTAMSDRQGRNTNPGEAKGTGMAYPNNRLPTFTGSHEATGHTASFPVGLPAWFIRAFTDENDLVFDPFCGAGSTVLAAQQEKRVCYAMEISTRYVDLICARFQKHTGIKPILEATGETHDFIQPITTRAE